MNVIHTFFRYILPLSSLLILNFAYAAPAEQDPLGQFLESRQAPDSDALDELIRSKTTTHTPKNPVVAKRERENNMPSNADNKVSKNDVDELLSSAMGFLGVAYRFGGASPTGFDCSGFMQYIFRRAYAINLPRTSAEQANIGVAVNREDLQAGDMVFFRTSGSRISHVGMYVGNNRFIHAPRTGKNIEITSLSNRYWDSRYATARRVKRNNAQNFIRQ